MYSNTQSDPGFLYNIVGDYGAVSLPVLWYSV